MDSIFFLASNLALAKTFWIDANNDLQKSAYPNVKNFTSFEENPKDLRALYDAIKLHGQKGHCLIKGQIHKPLVNEPRAGITKSEDSTHWICLDIDAAQFTSVKEFMATEPYLKDVAHIIQYSASYGVAGSTTLSAHIFIMLSGKVSATLLKTWLLERNLLNTRLREGITLTKAKAALHYPLDITVCQNDKIIFIAPPRLEKGVTCSIKDSERIQYVAGKPTLDVKHIKPTRLIESLREETRELCNQLRIQAGLKPLRSTPKWIGSFEVQGKPGEAEITGIREDGDFVRFNLNGGDSWAYYHPRGNPEFIHNFKGEPTYYTKELLPAYYKEAVAAAKGTRPAARGTTVLAFRDKRTATYWNGTWNPETKHLELHPAKSELQLNHWMQNHGMMPYEVIPVWDMTFDPQSNVILDEESQTINTYVPSDYFQADFTTKGSLDNCPLIKRIMLHAVSKGEEDETFEHWLNWLAVIFQKRIKPKTAWLFSGTEGTGKGVMFNSILAPLLGREYVQCRRASELEEKYNAWMEKALIAFIDEVEVPTSSKKEMISADLRNFITEDWVTVRAMNRIAISVRNYTGIAFSTNKSAAVMINSNDRRYNVGAYQPQRLMLTTHQIHGEGPGTINDELQAFMQYIMTREANVDQAATALRNAAHSELVESNKTSIDMLTSSLANGDIGELWDAVMDPTIAQTLNQNASAYAFEFHRIIKREIIAMSLSPKRSYKDKLTKRIRENAIITHESRLSRDELMIVFEHCVGNMPSTPNKFTSLLKHRNMKTERLHIDGRMQYGLKVEWRALQTWVEERMSEFNKADNTKLKRVK